MTVSEPSRELYIEDVYKGLKVSRESSDYFYSSARERILPQLTESQDKEAQATAITQQAKP